VGFRPARRRSDPEAMQQTTPDDAAREAGRRLKAIGLMVIALVLFSGLDASAKYLATAKGLPVTQIVWVRFVVQFVLLLVFVPAFGLLGVKRLFTTSRLPQQLVRSVLMVATTAFNFLALKYLRLDQTITVVFLAPLVVALLAGPVLGEWVGWRRFVAILVGFLGILIVVRPGFTEVHPAIGFAFGAMLAYAIFMLMTRQLAGHDPPLVTLFYSMFVGTLFGAPLAAGDWVAPPDLATWVMLGSLGILGGTGHYLFILAYGLAPASSISPFLYLQLLTMTALGYLVFGDVPDGWTLIGAAVVIGSGVYLVHRERTVAPRRRDEPDPDSAPPPT
jgi:drug/metabolite transporter (DMT)-like permease